MNKKLIKENPEWKDFIFTAIELSFEEGGKK